MGLFVKKKQMKRTKTSFAPDKDLSHLTPDGDLPWGWHTANKGFTEKIEAEYKQFFDAWYSSRKSGVLKEYAALKSLVLYMEDVKKLCDAKGECFAEWASIMVADPVAYKQRKERLAYIEANIKELTAEEQKVSK